MKHITFSGTQDGMSSLQKLRLYNLMREFLRVFKEEQIIFHHGDCIGADSEAHDIVRQAARDENESVYIEIHPCNIKDKRAFRIGEIAHSPLPPLERNKIMVDISTTIIIAPKTDEEIRRSGTWSTCRYAKSQHKEIYLLKR